MMMWLYDDHEYSLFTEFLMRKYTEYEIENRRRLYNGCCRPL